MKVPLALSPEHAAAWRERFPGSVEAVPSESHGLAAGGAP